MEHNVVSSRRAMLAALTPVLQNETYFYCTTKEEALLVILMPRSLATFREAEGFTMILSLTDAVEFNFDLSLPMCHIVLQVFSSLEGVGLTAGVASALADADLACNIVAAYHHDHVFVSKKDEQRAMRVLHELQRQAASQN